MNTDYEYSLRRLVKIVVLVLVADLLLKGAWFAGLYTGMNAYQYTPSDYGVEYADQVVDYYEAIALLG